MHLATRWYPFLGYSMIGETTTTRPQGSNDDAMTHTDAFDDLAYLPHPSHAVSVTMTMMVIDFAMTGDMCTQTSGLPPKLVETTQSEWEQTMQVVLTLFLDKRRSEQ